MLKNEGVREDREMEFDLIVSNPHPHPLIFYRQGKPDGPLIFCFKCKEEFLPPAFVCSDDNCNFNIHHSCIHLPDEIRSPFHNHVLDGRPINNLSCTCCSQSQHGASFRCSQECGFAMDVQCAMANPKASGLLKAARGRESRHFSHPHPLILHLDTDPERRISISVCLVCQRPITSSSSYYYCSRSLPQCQSYTFHQQCAELPRQMLNPDLHPQHPLVLLAKNPFHCICACCKTECTEFFYCCEDCKFNLHVYCLSSFNHKHIFHRFPYIITFECTICHTSNKAFPWHCIVCNQLAHKECAIFKMSEDLIDSSLTQDHDHLGNRIKHFSHKRHELTLCRPHEDMLCDGCMRYIPAMSQSYACPPCRFYLHKQCATLPTEHINSFLHPHVLSLVYISDSMFSCDICVQYCHGFAYRCDECFYVIDIQCTATKFPFKHPSHKHPLIYYYGSPEHLCKACGIEDLNFKKVIGCENCNFYLHVRCAHLPLAMINRFDEHPLILTFENHKEESEEKGSEEVESYCDVCEEERNVKEWFYECRICCFAAHTKCVVGDYPFLKSVQFKNHVHPLTLVNECTKKYSSRSCDACGDSWDGKLAFECGNSNCNFSMHAFGQCYHKQLTQGQITFTMPSLRYRSISLHPDQKWKSISSSTMKAKLELEKDKWPTALSFASQGSWRGKHWDDGVYSSIRALRLIYRHYWDDGVYSSIRALRLIHRHYWDERMGIQIEYEDKDGNSIWTDIHGLQTRYWRGTTEEVVTLNHPDEYLTSLHGWYDMDGIHSLSFETNQRILGPYGNELHNLPSSNEYQLIKFPASTELKIVGLHGRSVHGEKLTAIGFHFIET